MSESILERARREYAAQVDAAEADQRAQARVVREATEASARRLAVHIFGTEPESVVWVLGVEAVRVFYKDGLTLQYRGYVHSGPSNNWCGQPESFYIVESECPECGVTTYRGSWVTTWERFCEQLVVGIVKEQHAEDCLARPGLLDARPAPTPEPTPGERLVMLLEKVVGDAVDAHVCDYHQGRE
jgi:hypothetical protein